VAQKENRLTWLLKINMDHKELQKLEKTLLQVQATSKNQGHTMDSASTVGSPEFKDFQVLTETATYPGVSSWASLRNMFLIL
jgi:hypothetical protein